MSGPKTLEEALALPVLTQLEYIERVCSGGFTGEGLDGDDVCICCDGFRAYNIEHVQPEGWVRVPISI